MVIEVIVNIFREVITRTSKLRKRGLKSGEKLTSGGQKHWIDTITTKFDGKEKYVEARDHSNRAENGLGLAGNQTDSHPIRSREVSHGVMVLAVQ